MLVVATLVDSSVAVEVATNSWQKNRFAANATLRNAITRPKAERKGYNSSASLKVSRKVWERRRRAWRWVGTYPGLLRIITDRR